MVVVVVVAFDVRATSYRKLSRRRYEVFFVALRNSSVFSRLENCFNVNVVSCSDAGRLFQRLGPATEKLLGQYVFVRVDGTTISP